MSEAAPAKSSVVAEWRLPLLLLALTTLSTLYVGAAMESVDVRGPADLLAGWSFAIPLMAILLAHEMGHYVAGRIHRVPISPPYFIPMPMVLLGTLGAVIRMRGSIRTKNALLDVGASGPIAGMVIALPVLLYGLATSPIRPLPSGPEAELFFVEGRGLLYLGVLHLLHGPIPSGHDIFLTPTALAGWAGLLITQINLVPVGQLDGGHVAYALFGEKQDRYGAIVHALLPVLGVGVSLAYLVPAWLEGQRGAELMGEALAGVHWIVWAVVLKVMFKYAGKAHPPVGPEPLSTGRRWVAIGTLILFGLLFMPAWIVQG